MRRSVAVTGLLVTVGVLTGCTTTSPSPAPAAAATSSTPAPMDGGGDTAGGPYPTWDQPAAQQAAAVAGQVMADFTATTRDPDAWFAALAVNLTDAAQQAHWGTDPTLVPAHAVLGVQVVPGGSPFLATATVTTDVGPYVLALVRADGAAPWLVDSITPPEGVGP